MNPRFSRRYERALLCYLRQVPGARLPLARQLGRQALAAGLEALDIARLHEQTLVTQALPGHSAGRRAALIKRAAAFFAEAVSPIEKIEHSPRQAVVHLGQIVAMLGRRIVELAASKQELEKALAQRKAEEAARVPRTIREVKTGNKFLHSPVSSRQDRVHPTTTDRTGIFRQKVARLTSREMEVLRLIAEGKANKEMALELGIGAKTVEKHRGHLMQKLDIHDTAGLTRYAIGLGLIESVAS